MDAAIFRPRISSAETTRRDESASDSWANFSRCSMSDLVRSAASYDMRVECKRMGWGHETDMLDADGYP